jgi:hypothetical protein
MATRISRPATSAAGYPLVGAGASRTQRTAYVGALLVGIGMAYLYHLYTQSNDVSPDSPWGYAFAIGGTTLLLLAGGGYVLRKRRGRRSHIRLHTALAWHISGGLVGIGLIFMHAAGNFNSRSGTYALYALIAVVVSGGIGRLFDRVCPRLAAAAAAKALTVDGEDRLDALHQKLTAAQMYQQVRFLLGSRLLRSRSRGRGHPRSADPGCRWPRWQWHPGAVCGAGYRQAAA